MAALLDDASAGQHQDAVGPGGGGQPVGHDDRRAAPGQRAHGGGHPPLAAEVEVGRRLVEQEDGGVDEAGPGQSQKLALAARQGPAPLENHRVEAIGQAGDETVGADGARAASATSASVASGRP